MRLLGQVNTTARLTCLSLWRSSTKEEKSDTQPATSRCKFEDPKWRTSGIQYSCHINHSFISIHRAMNDLCSCLYFFFEQLIGKPCCHPKTRGWGSARRRWSWKKTLRRKNKAKRRRSRKCSEKCCFTWTQKDSSWCYVFVFLLRYGVANEGSFVEFQKV